ncbi:MAG: hypothetical protein H6872_15310 [Methylobacteriaceae bacterium]|nr:hypothetical protein [Methylobacteriaceae bacterium]MCC0006412.1 hypothetical protein [Methylobacteriaceae bacterium]
MSEETPRVVAPASEPPPSNAPAIFYILSFLLILLFLYRLLTPVHAMPSPTERNLTMVFDALMVVGLFGMKRSASNVQALFWIAAAAGVGLLLLRMTGEIGFWSGHLRFTYLPR